MGRSRSVHSSGSRILRAPYSIHMSAAHPSSSATVARVFNDDRASGKHRGGGFRSAVPRPRLAARAWSSGAAAARMSDADADRAEDHDGGTDGLGGGHGPRDE